MAKNSYSSFSTEGENPAIAQSFAIERRAMVTKQILARGIKSKRVLQALLKVPRHRFVESELISFAYRDSPLTIGYGQTISQPYIVAYMTEAAEISPGDKILEIGTGCGYQAAVLGELAKEVYTVEIIAPLAQKAEHLLQILGYQNIHIKIGDGHQGWAEHAPYDAILVAAAPVQIPQPLIDQLAVNGKIVIPVGTANQDLMVLTKKPTEVIEERTIPVRFVPLTESIAQSIKSKN